MDRHQLVLMRQRAALLRAIARAHAYQAHEDVDILQSVVRLLEDFHKLANDVRRTQH